MPTISTPTISCAQANAPDGDVSLEIAYTAVFSPLERFLAAHGLVFEEHVTVIGEDLGTGADLVLHTLPSEPIPVAEGTTMLQVPRRRVLTVPRKSLREDRGPSNDEIDARIDILAVGLPAPIVTAMTPEISLTPPSLWAEER